MDNAKFVGLLLSVFVIGSVFLSGAVNYGYAEAENNNQLIASFLKLAQTVDGMISPTVMPFPPQSMDGTSSSSFYGKVSPNMTPPPSGDFRGGTGFRGDMPAQGDFGEMSQGGFGKGILPQGDDRGFSGDGFMGEGGEGMDEDFFDPREARQVYREIKDLKREVKRLVSRIKKLPNADAMRSELDALSAKFQSFEATIKTAESTGSGLRDAVQEFRDANLWEELNTLRARIEIPTEMKNSERELKRVKKLITQKSFQNIGFDMGIVASYVSEYEGLASRLNSLYSSGSWEDLNSEMEDLHEMTHPGEISGVLYRMRDLYKGIKSIKDEEVRAEIEEALTEVKDSFNQKDFRTAREILDDSFDGLNRLIRGASKIGRRGGMSEEVFDENMERIRQMIETRLGARTSQIEQKERGEIEQEMPFFSPQGEMPQTSEIMPSAR